MVGCHSAVLGSNQAALLTCEGAIRTIAVQEFAVAFRKGLDAAKSVFASAAANILKNIN